MYKATPAEVKTLRERTAAGLSDCKKALEACEGDIEKAVDWLRKKGLVAAAKKAGRVATEGLIGVHVDGNHGTILEINAETDFVARNELFRNFVETAVKVADEKNLDVESLGEANYPGSAQTVADELKNLIATVGENMTLRRVAHVKVSDGVVASYVHNKVAPNLGKIGVLVAIESTGDKEKLQEFGKKIAMHVAAANPYSLSQEDLDPEILAREKAIAAEKARNEGKKEEFIDKIVEGRIRKFYEEAVLLEQEFIMSEKTKVKDAVSAFAKEIGAPVNLIGFVKFVLGEGIEKETVDFAAEVAAQLG